jgi:hypothetical protein
MREGCKSSGASEARGSDGVKDFRLGSVVVGKGVNLTGGARLTER